MQLDFRHFVMKLERIAEIKPLPHQEYVGTYVKAFYIPEAELEDWVKIHTVRSVMQFRFIFKSETKPTFIQTLFFFISGIHP